MGIEELALREIVRRSGVSQWSRVKRGPERERAELAHARAERELRESDLPLLILERPPSPWTRSRSRPDRRERFPRLGLVAIDYAQEVADTDPRTALPDRGRGGPAVLELARRLDVAVLVASQVNVVPGARAQYAFRESAILEHKASTVLTFVVDWDEDGMSAGVGRSRRPALWRRSAGKGRSSSCP